MSSTKMASPPRNNNISRRGTKDLQAGVLQSGLLPPGTTLNDIIPPGVSLEELGTEAERDKNRKMLNELYNAHQQAQAEHEQFKETAMSMLQNLGTQNQQLASELEKLKNENRVIKNEFHAHFSALNLDELRSSVQSNVAQLSARSSEMMARLSARNTEITSEVTNFKGLLGNVSAQSGDMKGQLVQMKQEVVAMKKELQGVKEKKVGKEEMERLKQGAQSKDQIARIEAKSDLATIEMRTLMRQLWERGVLAPKQPEPVQEEEEERPPVGTLGLGEDIFTARLLLRLGMMKAKCQAEEEFSIEEEGWSDAEFIHLADENVTGLAVPEIAEGSSAHRKVVCHSMCICVGTFVLQLVVLLIMLENARSMSGDCLKHPLSVSQWWNLHVSKALALAVTGMMMGKDLMDTANYWMVAELLMPIRSLEVTVTAIGRVSMTFVIVSATMFMFWNLTSPVDVWLNMTALGFISSLGADVLDVIRRGLFGHSMAKATTKLNFELTFMTQYPPWFATIHKITTLATVGVIATFAATTFSAKDLMCAA